MKVDNVVKFIVFGVFEFGLCIKYGDMFRVWRR